MSSGLSRDAMSLSADGSSVSSIFLTAHDQSDAQDFLKKLGLAKDDTGAARILKERDAIVIYPGSVDESDGFVQMVLKNIKRPVPAVCSALNCPGGHGCEPEQSYPCVSCGQLNLVRKQKPFCAVTVGIKVGVCGNELATFLISGVKDGSMKAFRTFREARDYCDDLTASGKTMETLPATGCALYDMVSKDTLDKLVEERVQALGGMIGGEDDARM